MPEKYDIIAKLSAGGLTATTKSALVVKRVPTLSTESLEIKSKLVRDMGETVEFETTDLVDMSIHGDQIFIKVLFYFTEYRPVHTIIIGDPYSGIEQFFVRKIGTDWEYFKPDKTHPDYRDLTKPAVGEWLPLLGSISDYNYRIVYLQKDESTTNYIVRGNFKKWPEPLAEYPNYEQQIKQWLETIQYVWDDRFKVRRKSCKSLDENCCSWRVRLAAERSNDETKGKKVAVICGEGRSDTDNWYLDGDPLVDLAAHEYGHLVGAPDEYEWELGPVLDAKEPMASMDSIMGCNSPRPYPRHLQNLGDAISRFLQQELGRNFELVIQEGERCDEHEECANCGKWCWPEKYQGCLNYGIANVGGALCDACYIRSVLPFYYHKELGNPDTFDI